MPADQPISSIGDVIAALPPANVIAASSAAATDRERRMANAAARNHMDNSGIEKKYRSIPMNVDPAFPGLPEFLDVAPAGEPRDLRQVREKYKAIFQLISGFTSIIGGALFGFLGDRGCGKTWMMSWLVKRFCLSGRPAKYAELSDFFAQLRLTMRPESGRSEIDVEREFLAPELLVLDAVEEKSDSDFQTRMFIRLCNKRVLREKITILISNDNPATFEDRIGRSLVDRLNDGGGIIVCDWPSLRGRLPGQSPSIGGNR